MLTLKECLDFSDLSEEEIDAIAEHEHIPEIVAAELGNYLVQSNEGISRIKHYMLDDIKNAELHGQRGKAQRLYEILDHFNTTHPSANLP